MSGPRLNRYDRLHRKATVSGGMAAPGALVLSSDLVDLYPTPLQITVNGPVTSVTLGGTPCTSVSQSGNVVTVTTPTKTAGSYDLVVTGPGGSTTLTNGVEVWSPKTTYAAARIFQSDVSVTSAGAASRTRTGIWSTDIVNGGASAPCDGQGLCRLDSGRLLLVCGAPNGNAANSVNTVWNSDDDGRTWSVLLANQPGAVTRFPRGHSQGYQTHGSWFYVIGGDPFAQSGEVWRTPLSGNGTAWELVSSSAPTATRSLMSFFSLGGNLYAVGGQTDMTDATTAVNHVFRSTDNGVSWTQLADAPWVGRGMISSPLPVIGTKAYITTGGAWDGGSGPNETFYNGVWSFDGSSWVEILPDGHAQFTARRYSTLLAFGNDLLVFNGSPSPGVENRDIYLSRDLGATWTLQPTAVWGNTHAAAGIALSDRILITEGFQTNDMHSVVVQQGALVSAWVDNGSGALSTSQSTNANKPVLQTDAFGRMPGVAYTGDQVLALSAQDSDATDGFYCYYVVMKSLNFDVASSSPANCPGTVFGKDDGTVLGSFGISGGDVRYIQNAAAVWENTNGGLSNLNDDRPRFFGAHHSATFVKLFHGSTQLVNDTTNVSFNTTYTGWMHLGRGYQGLDGLNGVIGAAVAIKPPSEPDSTFLGKFAKWARKWGSVS